MSKKYKKVNKKIIKSWLWFCKQTFKRDESITNIYISVDNEIWCTRLTDADNHMEELFIPELVRTMKWEHMPMIGRNY